MSCRILLIRHGETEWNANHRVQGHTDSPLNERGRNQARLLAERLASTKIHSFYSSDLDRAKETAGIVALPHGLPVLTDPRLRELDFGKWEGLKIEEVEAMHPGMMKSWWKNPLDNHFPGTEKLTDLISRCEQIMESIINRHQEETVAVVSHGGTIRSIICTVLGIKHSELWRIYIDNTSISRIDFLPGWKGVVMVLNDHAHLD